MRKRHLNHIKLGYVILLVCLALLLASSARKQYAAVSTGKSANSDAQSRTMTTGTRARYNGKLDFSSDRQNDGGLRLWTMNPDGSNQTQLTFESERGPTLPDYVLVYDDFCKWSPDGTKIALRSNRDLDLNDPALDGYTIHVMDYYGNSVQRMVLDRLSILSSRTDAEIGRIDWSTDGTKLAFGYCTTILSGIVGDNNPTVDIYTVNIDGSGLTRLTTDGVSVAPS